MTPDETSSRLARVEQRVTYVEETLRSMAPIAAQMASLSVNVTHVQEDLHDCREDVRKLHRALDERDERVSKERRDTRIALWSLVGVLCAALISGSAAIVAAVAG